MPLADSCSRAHSSSGKRQGITAQVTAAIVTCGGLCPGLNDVVQNIVYTLADYGVPLDQVLLRPRLLVSSTATALLDASFHFDLAKVVGKLMHLSVPTHQM